MRIQARPQPPQLLAGLQKLLRAFFEREPKTSLQKKGLGCQSVKLGLVLTWEEVKDGGGVPAPGHWKCCKISSTKAFYIFGKLLKQLETHF